MTDSQRNCFLAVAEHRSFSRAADALYVSQPAVSKNISTLEAEIGTPLFDRQGKYIELTRAGEIFFNFLVEYRRELDAMLEPINPELSDWIMDIGKNAVQSLGQFATNLSAGAVKWLANSAASIPGAIVTIIPSVIIYILGQDYIIKGMTAGGLKG